MIGAVETLMSNLPLWLTGVAIPIAAALLASGVVVHQLRRNDAKRERRRDGYGEALAALAAWAEYAYRVRRRTSDHADELARLAAIGHDLQERLARAQAWIATDNTKMFSAFQGTLSEVKKESAPFINEAWTLPPIANPAEMNLGEWGPRRPGAAIAELAEKLSRAMK